MKTMRPQFRCFIPGRYARLKPTPLSTLTSKNRRQSSSEISSNGFGSNIPRLFTRMSTDGNCWSSVSVAAAARTLRQGLGALGEEVVSGLRFVCSDMWQPYLKVMAAKATEALHVLDRFHITMPLNQ